MANANWKVTFLLLVTLLVALGLQAGAIKIMINLARPSDPPAVANVRTLPPKPGTPVPTPAVAPRQPTVPEEENASEPAPAARESKPTVLVSDPPHRVDSTAKADPATSEPTPEIHQSPAATPPTAAPPSPEAATVQAEAKPQPNASDHAANAPVAAAPAVAPAAAESNAAPAETVASSELQEPAWLKARDPKHYTVQLYSGKDIGTLREIATAAVSAEPQAYYSTGSRSGPWYALVVGDYPDAATARAAAAKLTARSPALKPWVRRFDEIQAKMR